MSADRLIWVDLSDEAIAELTLLGFWKPDEYGVLELTPEGNAWVSAWCARKMAEATA